MTSTWDAVVVGSGPNGLAAAITLAQDGHRVCVLESASTIGGGLRTVERTPAGFLFDECSAIHPLGSLSPFFRTLPLSEHGLKWRRFSVSVAHPLDDGPAPVLSGSFERTGDRLGDDGDRWRRLVRPFLDKPHVLFSDILSPVTTLPRGPLTLARFGLTGLNSAQRLVHRHFRGEAARALFGGLAAHSVLPLDFAGTAAVGLVFAIAAAVEDWPCAEGGSGAIAAALASLLRTLGGTIELDRPVRCPADLPPSRVVLFDLAPRSLAQTVGSELPAGYLRRLESFSYGPGVFKLDWALDGPIPWLDPAVAEASTVHLGGTFEEIAASECAAWEGRGHDLPFVILCQQSHADPTRAPEGKHTGYAYCHVPSGDDRDMTGAIEARIERFAPGFRDRILARHATTPRDFKRLNPNLVGGSITGGANTLGQLFFRPVARLDPYSTPNPRFFLCSASTPPGGGVHGMCGFHAAKTAIRRLHSIRAH